MGSGDPDDRPDCESDSEVVREVRTDEAAAPSNAPAGRSRRPMLTRTLEALGPVVGGLILDAVDVATFGPLGLTGGFLIGGIFGWWLSGVYRMAEPRRPWVALAAGVYCALPLTEALPLATIAAVIARFAGPGDEGDS